MTDTVVILKVCVLWAALPFIVAIAVLKDLAEAVWGLYGPARDEERR